MINPGEASHPTVEANCPTREKAIDKSIRAWFRRHAGAPNTTQADRELYRERPDINENVIEVHGLFDVADLAHFVETIVGLRQDELK